MLEIEHINKTDDIKFPELPVGAVFEYRGHICMKVRSVFGESEVKDNAVELETGMSTRLRKYDVVYPVKAKLTYENVVDSEDNT